MWVRLLSLKLLVRRALVVSRARRLQRVSQQSSNQLKHLQMTLQLRLLLLMASRLKLPQLTVLAHMTHPSREESTTTTPRAPQTLQHTQLALMRKTLALPRSLQV